MGEPDLALAEVCRGEYARLVGLHALLVGDRAVAEELAQETLIRLIRRWPDVDRPAAWLTKVSVNVANSWLRRRFAERRAYARHGHTDETQRAADPADVMAVRAAVAGLPMRQRTVVVLRFYEQLTVAETAQLMDCAEGTVKALTNRAVQTLGQRGGLQPNETELMSHE